MVCLVQEQDKINILKYIAKKGLIVDRFKFLDEEDIPVTCMSVAV